jgi:hypothetical protein
MGNNEAAKPYAQVGLLRRRRKKYIYQRFMLRLMRGRVGGAIQALSLETEEYHWKRQSLYLLYTQADE